MTKLFMERKYSGAQSQEFWDFINGSCPKEAYLLACLLQDVEHRVFQILAAYEEAALKSIKE